VKITLETMSQKNRTVSTVFEEKIEKYVYNWFSALAAIGGSLGLFLGYSCFSVINILLKTFQKSYSLANSGQIILEMTTSE
jgi:hypothetical protein